jgi:hypothetical protein
MSGVCLGVQYLGEGGLIILREFNLLPPFCGGVHSFGSFDVEIKNTVLFTDRGVFGEERTRLTGTEAGDIIFVPAETLGFGSDVSEH